jgi:hypothetical protein
MARKGRDREKLVAALEKFLSDKEVEIKSPDYIKGVISEGRREIDVSLRNVGSTETLTIFEIRKRKKGDDVTWIEQLNTKRQDVLADKVVAVSSSSFSKSAKTMAEKLGIELRTLNELEDGNLPSWLQTLNVIFNPRDWYIRNVVLRCENKDIPSTTINTEEIALINPFTKEKKTISQLWEEIQKLKRQEFDFIEATSEPRQGDINVSFNDPEKRYQIVTEFVSSKIVEITFQVELSTKAELIPRDKAIEYTKNGKVLTTSAYFTNSECTVTLYHKPLDGIPQDSQHNIVLENLEQ